MLDGGAWETGRKVEEARLRWQSVKRANNSENTENGGKAKRL
jgi:hypothetical protein